MGSFEAFAIVVVCSDSSGRDHPRANPETMARRRYAPVTGDDAGAEPARSKRRDGNRTQAYRVIR